MDYLRIEGLELGITDSSSFLRFLLPERPSLLRICDEYLSTFVTGRARRRYWLRYR
jgi:hypothetical protein